ncbi:MAG: dihydroorotate dehydrogenase electron transfer subunit [Kiritimatiellia bacterium]
MQLSDSPILANDPVGPDYRMMTLGAPGIAAAARPGQFIHLRIPNIDPASLRRPFSICDAADGRLRILYKQVGRGTAAMTRLKPGDVANILGPLGNGFPRPAPEATPLLVAGGHGVAPLLFLARRTPRKGVLFAGGRSARDVLLIDEFKAIGWETRVCTDDGSLGTRGFVTAALDAWQGGHPATAAELFACGPGPLLAAVDQRAERWGRKAWLSLDRHMGCGVGACLGCVQKIRRTTPVGETRVVQARVCKDGPVFASGAIVWEGL